MATFQGGRMFHNPVIWKYYPIIIILIVIWKNPYKIYKRLSVQYIDHCLKKTLQSFCMDIFGSLGKIKMLN